MRIGIDMLAFDELDRLVERPWFTRYVFAESELGYARTLAPSRRREYLAGRFAGKEAVLKVLGVGLFEGVPPHDIVIDRSTSGGPEVRLHRGAADAASRAHIDRVTVSITHKRDLVAAVAAGW